MIINANFSQLQINSRQKLKYFHLKWNIKLN